MKRLLSMVLSFALILALAPATFAASDEAVAAANALYEQGLFSGTGTDVNGNPNFDLDRAPTRHEAITMLVRLLGKTNEAENGTWNTPFTDVADWAKPYVGYAYNNQLVSGTSATTFGGNDTVSVAQYLTFVLRALGYESGTDFQWDKAWELSDAIGLTDDRYNAETASFSRGDVAIISQKALQCNLKNQTQPLQQVLPDTPPNVPSSDFAAKETKAAIMENVADGLLAEKAGLENNMKASEFLSMGQSRYALTFCKESITNFQTAITKFNAAISLCANYGDTKTVKANLVSMCDNLSSLCSTELTEQNYMDYLVDGVIFAERNKNLQEEILQEFENWTGSGAASPTTESTPSTNAAASTDTTGSTGAKGSFAHDPVLCKKGGDAMVWLQNAEAAEWKSCCSEVLITNIDGNSCDIYVLNSASTRKHHYVECTDTKGYKYICMLDVF